jgi:hypothetical protein
MKYNLTINRMIHCTSSWLSYIQNSYDTNFDAPCTGSHACSGAWWMQGSLRSFEVKYRWLIYILITHAHSYSVNTLYINFAYVFNFYFPLPSFSRFLPLQNWNPAHGETETPNETLYTVRWCAFQQLMSLQWCSGRKIWKSKTRVVSRHHSSPGSVTPEKGQNLRSRSQVLVLKKGCLHIASISQISKP